MASKPDKQLIKVNIASSPRLEKTLKKLSKSHQREATKLLERKIKLIESLTWSEGYGHTGLNFEKIKASSKTGRIYYTLRLSEKWRLSWFRVGNEMVIENLHPDHDSAYYYR